MSSDQLWQDAVDQVHTDYEEGKIGEAKFYERMEALISGEDANNEINMHFHYAQEARAQYIQENSQFGMGA